MRGRALAAAGMCSWPGTSTQRPSAAKRAMVAASDGMLRANGTGRLLRCGGAGRVTAAFQTKSRGIFRSQVRAKISSSPS
jgi:hypothetical protein